MTSVAFYCLRVLISFGVTALILHCEFALFGETVQHDITLSIDSAFCVGFLFQLAWVAIHFLFWDRADYEVQR